MEKNDIIREQIFEIIKNQLKANNPPETKKTLNRLIKLGYSEMESKQLIGQCVVVELFDVMKNEKTFDEKRYINNLKKLPDEPFD